MPDKPVVILDAYLREIDEIFTPQDLQKLHDMADVKWGKDEHMPQDVFMAALPEAEVVICWDWRYGDVLPQAKKLRAIVSVEGAYPLNLDTDYCFANHIRVNSIAPAFARQVAEMCVGMAIDACREISLGDRAFRDGTEKYLHAGNVGNFLLYDKPVGFVGYGSIARELQTLLTPFGVSFAAYDPWLADGFIRSRGVQPKGIEALMSESRFIFILAAPTVENRAFLDGPLLQQVQQDAVVVLMSRAHVVDFDALTELVLAGRFRFATDVLPTEPLVADHPIRQAPNAILSAHRAGSVREGLHEIGFMVVHDVEAILRGFPTQFMQSLQPEMTNRYASIVVPSDED